MWGNLMINRLCCEKKQQKTCAGVRCDQFVVLHLHHHDGSETLLNFFSLTSLAVFNTIYGYSR